MEHTTTTDASDIGGRGQDLNRRLDQLIPASQPSFLRLLVSVAIVGMAVAFAALNLGGWFYPRPTALVSYSSGGPMWTDPDRELVAAQVHLPNRSRRDLRVTDIGFDAPGARLVAVDIYLPPPNDGDEIDGVATDSGDTAWPWRRSIDERVTLPVTVPSRRDAWLIVWFEPETCQDAHGTWGVVEATLDFGQGAFPPISRTLALADDPVFDTFDDTATVVAGDDVVSADGPLAAACEAIR
jgi:hypothetical protein